MTSLGRAAVSKREAHLFNLLKGNPWWRKKGQKKLVWPLLMCQFCHIKKSGGFYALLWKKNPLPEHSSSAKWFIIYCLLQLGFISDTENPPRRNLCHQGFRMFKGEIATSHLQFLEILQPRRRWQRSVVRKRCDENQSPPDSETPRHTALSATSEKFSTLSCCAKGFCSISTTWKKPYLHALLRLVVGLPWLEDRDKSSTHGGY